MGIGRIYGGWHLMSIITFTSTAPIKSPQQSSTFPLANVCEREPDKRPTIILLLRCELRRVVNEGSPPAVNPGVYLLYTSCQVHRYCSNSFLPTDCIHWSPLRDQWLPRYMYYYKQSLKQSPHVNTSCVDKPTTSLGFSSSKIALFIIFFYK